MHQFNFVKIAAVWASILKTIWLIVKLFVQIICFDQKVSWPFQIGAPYACAIPQKPSPFYTLFDINESGKIYERHSLYVPSDSSYLKSFNLVQSLSTLWTHQTRKCFGPDLSLLKSVYHIWTNERASEREREWLLTFSHLNRQIFA